MSNFTWKWSEIQKIFQFGKVSPPFRKPGSPFGKPGLSFGFWVPHSGNRVPFSGNRVPHSGNRVPHAVSIRENINHFLCSFWRTSFWLSVKSYFANILFRCENLNKSPFPSLANISLKMSWDYILILLFHWRGFLRITSFIESVSQSWASE